MVLKRTDLYKHQLILYKDKKANYPYEQRVVLKGDNDPRPELFKLAAPSIKFSRVVISADHTAIWLFKTKEDLSVFISFIQKKKS